MLRSKYLNSLRSWWKSHTLQDTFTSSKSIVIYETRCHEQLEFLILNCTYFASKWGLTIFCSDENYAFICDVLGNNKDKARIIVCRQEEGNYSDERDVYNTVLKSRHFWDTLHGYGYSHVLMAEVDAYLCDHIDAIESINEYDYIASRWNWVPDAPGGGGLTIRRVSKMLELCDLDIDEPMQDCWASEGIRRVGGIVNNTLFAESCLLEKVWGVHQWWAFVEPNTKHKPIYDRYMCLNIDTNS